MPPVRGKETMNTTMCVCEWHGFTVLAACPLPAAACRGRQVRPVRGPQYGHTHACGHETHDDHMPHGSLCFRAGSPESGQGAPLQETRDVTRESVNNKEVAGPAAGRTLKNMPNVTLSWRSHTHKGRLQQRTSMCKKVGRGSCLRLSELIMAVSPPSWKLSSICT